MHVALTKYTANGLPTPLAVMYNSYKYDQLNRIKAHNAFTGASATSYTAHTNTNEHKNTFTYDANGNILTQTRNGSSASGLAMDNLTYNYITGTNQLASVADAVGNAAYTDDLDNQAANNYGYDELGQLVRDDKEEIATIEWTVYGKIKRITRTSSSTKPDLEFKYDAMGQRILKLVKPKASAGVYKEQKDWSYTYYVRDASGNVMGVYKRSFTPNVGNTEVTDALELEESQIYGSSRLGIDLRKGEGILSSITYTLFGTQNGEYQKGQVVVSSSLPGAVIRQWNRKLGYKNYELSNHLGNVLVTISDRKLAVQGNPLTFVGKYLADVVATNDYSAFGAPMVGRGFNSPSYRYGFNGKENDAESVDAGEGLQDYGMRIYNPSIGKFLSVDPLAPEYPWNSTYAFAENDVIRCIDLDGAEKYYRNNAEIDQSVALSDPKEGDIFVAANNAFQYIYMIDPNTSKGEWVERRQSNEVTIQAEPNRPTIDFNRSKYVGGAITVGGSVYKSATNPSSFYGPDLAKVAFAESAEELAKGAKEVGYTPVRMGLDMATLLVAANKNLAPNIPVAGMVMDENLMDIENTLLTIGFSRGYQSFINILEPHNRKYPNKVGGFYMTQAEYEEFRLNGSINFNNLTLPVPIFEYFNNIPLNVDDNTQLIYFVVITAGNINRNGTIEFIDTNALLRASLSNESTEKCDD
jgi:RHS repeat-associated protein